jgi:hypothetical protein
LEGDVPAVHAAGFLGMKGTAEEEGTIKDTGHVVYRRKFEKLPEGLRITSELLSRGEDARQHRGVEEDRRDRLVELWENLPIYVDHVRRGAAAEPNVDHVRRGAAAEPTTVIIEYSVNGTWRTAGVDPTAGVSAVRVTRFGHPVVIEFDAPQQVDLADHVVRTSYQSRDLIQNLRVDLLRTGGRAATMPKRARVSYTIRSGR